MCVCVWLGTCDGGGELVVGGRTEREGEGARVCVCVCVLIAGSSHVDGQRSVCVCTRASLFCNVRCNASTPHGALLQCASMCTQGCAQHCAARVVHCSFFGPHSCALQSVPHPSLTTHLPHTQAPAVTELRTRWRYHLDTQAREALDACFPNWERVVLGAGTRKKKIIRLAGGGVLTKELMGSEDG